MKILTRIAFYIGLTIAVILSSAGLGLIVGVAVKFFTIGFNLVNTW